MCYFVPRNMVGAGESVSQYKRRETKQKASLGKLNEKNDLRRESDLSFFEPNK